MATPQIPWPPVKLAHININIVWSDLLPSMTEEEEGLVLITTADPDRIKSDTAHYKLLSGMISRQHECFEEALPFPFLFSGTNRFKGMGTNKIEYAQQFCMYSLATLFWNKACEQKIGTEYMVRYFSMCVRCLHLAGQDTLKTDMCDMYPDIAHSGFFTIASVIMDLIKYSVSTKPPAQCERQQLLEAISMLNSAMTRINENAYMSTISSFVKKATQYIVDELYFCNGVFILTFLQLPFSSVPHSSYLNVKDTARLYVESYACLSKTKRDTAKYKSSIEKKMESGYANEYTETPSFCMRILQPEGLQKHVPITLLSTHILNLPVNEMKEKLYTSSNI